MSGAPTADAGRIVHAPGLTRLGLDGTYVVDERGRTVADCGRSPHISRAEKVANARLFAAAPDLVKALKHIAKEWPDSSAAKTARAALAKPPNREGWLRDGCET